MEISTLIETLKKYQWETNDEKILQDELFQVFLQQHGFIKEYRLDNKNILDFFHPKNGLAIECKTKGTSMNIYRQLKRYAKFKEVKNILLISSKAMALPKEIETKPAVVYLLGKNWL